MPFGLFIFPPAAPAPTGLTAAVQVDPTSVTVSWTQSGTVTGYWINYASGGGEDSGSAGLITGTSHTLDNLLDGLTYNITVIAVDGSHLPSEGARIYIAQCKLMYLNYSGLFQLEILLIIIQKAMTKSAYYVGPNSDIMHHTT